MRRARAIFPRDEEWLELAQEPSYLVSTHGRCYNTRTGHFMTPTLHDVRPEQGRLGHYIWYLTRPLPDGGRRKLMVSAAPAILTAFYMPRPNHNWVPEYIDGDRANLHIDNLSWIPRQGPEHYSEMARRKNALHPNRRGRPGPRPRRSTH